MMTVNELHACLIAEVEEILKDLVLQGADGKDKRIKGYPHAVPVYEVDIGWRQPEKDCPIEEVDQEELLFPYFVTRVSSIDYAAGEASVIVYLFLGIYDDDKSMRGYFSLLNAIERITNRFRTNTVLSPFWCDGDMAAAIQDDDSYPHFFGGIEMTWHLPILEVEGNYE